MERAEELLMKIKQLRDLREAIRTVKKHSLEKSQALALKHGGMVAISPTSFAHVLVDGAGKPAYHVVVDSSKFDAGEPHVGWYSASNPDEKGDGCHNVGDAIKQILDHARSR